MKTQMVYVDETWLTIRGRWPYGFVVLEVHTELSVRTALLPSPAQWAGRWSRRPLRQLKNVPRVFSTEGFPAYASLGPGAQHVLCRLHHQQSVPHWLQQHCTTADEIAARTPLMNKVVQTRDKRTVRRRLAASGHVRPRYGFPPGAAAWKRRGPS